MLPITSKKIIKSVFVNFSLCRNVRDEEVNGLIDKVQDKAAFEQAVKLTDELALGENFVDFLTLPAYKILLQREEKAKL